jgi:hypothetical protein
MRSPYPGVERLRSKLIEMTNGECFPVYYLCDYFPKRFAQSESPDSKAILMVKDGLAGGATHFLPRIKEALGAQRASAMFVVMPGHSPVVEGSGLGLRLLVRALGDVKDLSGCLVRTVEVQKSSTAPPGQRPDVRKHIKTMACRTVELIRSHDVILFDDVVTRGETMRAGRYLLLNAGASSVTCLTLGKTTRV